MATDNRSRLKLLLLAALFFLPLILAYALYFGPDSWKPQARTAHGDLIDPAHPLPAVDGTDANGAAVANVLAGKWTLLQFIDAGCDEDCAHRIWQTRQLRTSLHKYAERVQRVLIVPTAVDAAALQQRFAAEHPHLVVVSVPPALGARLRAEFAAEREPGAVHLIDPLGNWLMTYRGDLDLRGMYTDIKRLLKLSNIG